MASRELDELNEAYEDSVNTRMWNAALRVTKGDKAKALDRTKRDAARELNRAYEVDYHGVYRPRKVRQCA
jgi:hypothetical protein